MSSASAPGELLASGRWTDVYDIGGGRVLKRYRDAAAAPIASFEAEVMVHARAHGVPVPEVFDVHGGDIVLEKVVGPTMLRALTRHPGTMSQHARTMAGLHDAVHQVAAPPGDIWSRYLERVRDLIPEGFGLGQPFGPGGVLLHLDLHPDNIILSPSGPVLIDWQGAVVGPPGADTAHTWLLIRTSVIPGPLVQRTVGSLGQRIFARTFLGHVDAAEARRYLPAVAARRLQDPSLREAEAAKIRRIVRAVS